MEWMILPLRRYADFRGRSTRKEFWMWILFLIIVTIVLSFVDKILGLGGTASYGTQSATGPGMTGFRAGASFTGGWITKIFDLAVLVPNIAVAVRRLHDTDRSGWWILMPVLPYALGFVLIFSGQPMIGGLISLVGFICAIVLLVWYCLRGTPGPNRFGPDPLAPMGDLHETFR